MSFRQQRRVTMLSLFIIFHRYYNYLRRLFCPQRKLVQRQLVLVKRVVALDFVLERARAGTPHHPDDRTVRVASTASQPNVVTPLLERGDYKTALALCGALKYANVAAMTDAKRVEGFLANLAGTSDEHAVVAAAKA